MSDNFKPENILSEVEEAANAAVTELTEGDLENCSGGALSLGDIDSLFKGASSFFEQSGVSLEQASFAGPNGAGSISSLDALTTKSGNSDAIGLGL
jgi:hypothetical protein